MYWFVTDKMEGSRHALLYGATLTVISSIVWIAIFELINVDEFWTIVAIDILHEGVVLALFFLVKETVKKLSESFIGAQG